MAFANKTLNTDSQSTAGEGVARRRQRGDQIEAAGFINIYAPASGGKRHKLGFVILDQNVPWMKKLADRLEANPNDIEALKQVLQLEFNTPSNGDSEVEF